MLFLGVPRTGQADRETRRSDAGFWLSHLFSYSKQNALVRCNLSALFLVRDVQIGRLS